MTYWRTNDQVTWLTRCWIIAVTTLLTMSCAPNRAFHEKTAATPNDYRRLAWQMMEDVAQLKIQLPYLDELDLTNNLTETFQPMRLQLTYEHGTIQVANARWIPDDHAPKTIQHYTRDGVFFRLSLTLESQTYQQSVAANRIGQLLITLDTQGPKAHQIRSMIGHIVNKHRSQFARTFRL